MKCWTSHISRLFILYLMCLQSVVVDRLQNSFIQEEEVEEPEYSDHREVSHLLDHLLQGYDNNLRPDFGGPPTQVDIDIEVRSIGPISEIEMMYSMVCYFRQSWTDKRLAFELTNMSTLALSISMLNRIWKPDTYFHNGKRSHLHTMTIPNRFVRLNKNGSILYSSRLTIRASCEMSLENFPMDKQICMLELGSYGYTSNEVLYSWNKDRQIVINNSQMGLSQFEVVSHPHGNRTRESKKVLLASFHLRRFMGYFMIQVYAPCTLLVILSWVSFWINREATADRVALGVMTILTMTFLGLDNRNALPKVSYATALDLFLAISYAFVFGTLLQFALVHYFTKYGSGEEYFFSSSESSSDEDDDDEEAERRSKHAQPKMDVVKMEREELLTLKNRAENSGIRAKKTEDSKADSSQSHCPESEMESQKNIPRMRPGICRRISICIRRSLRRRDAEMRSKKRQQTTNSVSKIDQISRFLFPLLYIIINLVYWLYYLNT